MIASGCGAASPSPEPPARLQWQGELVDLVPEGASVVVRARPAELARAAATHRVIVAIASEDRLESYRQHTGIDPRELDELVWARTDEGSVLVIRGPFSAPLAVAEMGARMLPIEARADEPFVRRVGHYQGERRDLIAIADGVLLAITGPPSLAQAVLARVRGEDTSPGALRSGDAVALFESAAGAPIAVHVPTPLGLPPGSGLALLLARERALMGTLVPSGPEALDVSVDLRGEFPPGADQNFRALFESVAESDLGAALGMRGAVSTLRVEASEEGVVVRATLASAAVAAGLRVLFDAEIAELVRMPDPTDGVAGAATSQDGVIAP